jgi:hypothetical protein
MMVEEEKAGDVRRVGICVVISTACVLFFWSNRRICLFIKKKGSYQFIRKLAINWLKTDTKLC